MTNKLQVTMDVNGKSISWNVPHEMLLDEFLRNDLRLTGLHVGCDTSQCGACTVLINGDAIKSCTMFVAQANGTAITTIEGVAELPAGRAVVKAFHECHGLQCGFCTPGFVMSVVELITKNNLTDGDKIRRSIEGNICRCTGYHNIVRAVVQAQAELAQA